ncbi:hypothetical protein SAMN04487997_2565 [Frateuria terrea]|uniref:Uncharacterized protein n=1 Tax=Frateuria terrea TaxID=529704 RepID=A0A1H6WMM2_9GAMM|nr:hypothetical protein SAMN04487997_2565 [Frateuria terrea]
MKQFIPFEDDWDVLERLDASRLVPYQVDLPCERGAAQRTVPISPSTVSSSPASAPMRRAVPAGSSRT